MRVSQFIKYTPEVKNAIESNQPVVALESTVISHGMPYPDNLSTAKRVEQAIRDNGAIPATIGVIKGVIHIGMTDEDLEFMAQSEDILKASRRDLPVIVSKKLNAATTVASTMMCAKLASIKIFATGGIGGVHRNAESTFDISADLQELSNTDVAVVSAGAKSILDIPRTLEYLETMGVPVIGYKSHEFPEFYSRNSGLPVNYRLNTPEEIADLVNTKWNMGMRGGVLIANPIPEEYSMEKTFIDQAIDESLEAAEKGGIRGKEITPYLLSKITDITDGKSLESNIALILNNAVLAARIAVQMATLMR